MVQVRRGGNEIFKVGVRAFALFIIVGALLGFFTVYQRSSKTAAQYKLAKLLQEERRLGEEIVRANNRLALVMSPQYLDKMNIELKLGMEPLRRYHAGLEREKRLDVVNRVERKAPVTPAMASVAVAHRR